jgi:hypothetical protein
LVDRKDYVMAVVGGAPKGESSWWKFICDELEQHLRRLRVKVFSGEIQPQIRLGMTYAQDYTVSDSVKCLINRANWLKAPHGIGNDKELLGEIDQIERSDPCQAISGFQNRKLLSPH